MNLIKLTRFALLAALFVLPGVICPAQDKPEPQAARPVHLPPDIVSIDFPGGPFSKLVAELGKEGKLSLIQSPGIDPTLPAFSVHNAPISSVIAALGQLLDQQGYRLNATGPGLAVLSKNEHPHGQAFASFQLDSKIGPYPGQARAEDIIAAIQQGCEFASEGKPSTLRFKYHPATKLLFVAGTEMEVDVAHRVFGSLPNVEAVKPPPQDQK